jgi:two-component system cell cycle response regulator CtrA
MPDYEARIRMLEDELTLKDERIRLLEEAIAGANVEDHALYFDLTPQQAICFGVLLKNRAPRRSAFMAALYSGRADDEIEPKIIDVFICQMRKKLIPLGIEIKTHWGECYEMPETSKARARALMEMPSG